MNLCRRMVTTSRPKITQSIWEEAHLGRSTFIKVDKTPSKLIPRDNVRMAVKGTKHIPRKGGNDKRGITVTLSETVWRNATVSIDI